MIGPRALVNPIVVGTVFVLIMFIIVEIAVVLIDKYNKHKALLRTEEE